MHCNFTPFPTLTTSRVVLRRIELSDDQEIFFQRSDKQMNEFLDRPPAAAIEDARKWIVMITDIMNNNNGITWGTVLKGTKPLMGGVCFWNLDREINKADIGFSLHPEYWGQGLMQEVLEASIGYGFKTMQLATINAETHWRNTRSRRLLERNGFALKGPVEDSNYLLYQLHNPG